MLKRKLKHSFSNYSSSAFYLLSAIVFYPINMNYHGDELLLSQLFPISDQTKEETAFSSETKKVSLDYSQAWEYEKNLDHSLNMLVDAEMPTKVQPKASFIQIKKRLNQNKKNHQQVLHSSSTSFGEDQHLKMMLNHSHKIVVSASVVESLGENLWTDYAKESLARTEVEKEKEKQKDTTVQIAQPSLNKEEAISFSMAAVAKDTQPFELQLQQNHPEVEKSQAVLPEFSEPLSHSSVDAFLQANNGDQNIGKANQETLNPTPSFDTEVSSLEEPLSDVSVKEANGEDEDLAFYDYSSPSVVVNTQNAAINENIGLLDSQLILEKMNTQKATILKNNSIDVTQQRVISPTVEKTVEALKKRFDEQRKSEGKSRNSVQNISYGPSLANKVATSLAQKKNAEIPQESLPSPKMPEMNEINQRRQALYKVKNSEINLKLFQLNLLNKKLEPVGESELRPWYDTSKVIVGSEQGQFVLSSQLADYSSILSVELSQEKIIPINVDLLFEKGNADYNIITFEEKSWKEFLKINHKEDSGAILMLELNEQVSHAKLSCDSEGTFFLNEHFQVLSKKEMALKKVSPKAHFQVVFGIEPGQCLINFMSRQNTLFRKVGHFIDSSMSFESADWYRMIKSPLSLFESQVLSHEETEMELKTEDITNFTFQRPLSKKSFHVYDTYRFDGQSASRSYLEFRHQPTILFAGIGHQSKLTIPQDDFLNLMSEKFGFDDQSQKCIIQINVARMNVLDVQYDAPSSRGTNLQIYYLAKNGEWADGPVSDLKTIFFVGDEDEAVSLRIQYMNGKSHYLTTFCTEKTYLVEQL
jgi:hypothetical protein